MKARLQIPVQKNLRKIGATLAVALLVAGVVVYTQTVSAATAVLLPNTDITTDWLECNAGTCTNDHYTYVDEDVASPNDSDFFGTGGPGVSGDSPVVEMGLTTATNVDTVSSIQVNIRARIQTVGSTADQISINLRIGGSLQTPVTVSPSTTAYGNHTATFNGSWTQAQLDGAQVVLTRIKNGSGNPTNQQDDVRISAVSATVTYTQTITFDQSSYRWFEDSEMSSTFAKSWGGTSSDEAHDIAMDSSGNVYTVGETNSSGLTSGTDDMTLVKYNLGGTEQWAKTLGGSGFDQARALTLDDTGNIYVVGQSNSVGVLSSGSDDQVLVKYNSSGVEQWTKTWGGSGTDIAQDVALDSDGNIYVAGKTDSTGLTAGSDDQTLVKYNSSGVEQWSKTWGGDSLDGALSLAIDESNSIYVVGYTSSTGLTAGSSDQTLVKYNSSGVEQWSKTWGGDGYDDANAIALDDLGNIYVAGVSSSTGLTAGSSDQTLVKYNSSGVEQWSKTWGGDAGDYAEAIALDDSGNIYIAGSTSSTGLTAGSSDQTLVKYNSSGVEQWSKTWGGSSSESANSLTLDSTGNVYVAGNTFSSGLTAGSDDQTLLKFDSTGGISDCDECVNRTMTEVDRTIAEVDRTTTEVDRSTTEVDRTISEVDRTAVATITVASDLPGVDVGAPLAAANTATNATGQGVPFRLRMTVHVNTAQADPASADFKLQYAQRGADNVCDTSFTNETYADLSPSSGAIRYYNNPNAADGQALAANANDPTHSTDDVVLQTYEESNNFTIANAIPAGDDGLWDFSLVNNSASPGTSYCFRAVTSTGSSLASYGVIPQIDIPVPSYSQANYRFYENADSASPGAALEAQDTPATIAAETPFRLRQLLGVDTGTLAQGTNFELEYGEKLTVCSAASYSPMTSDTSVAEFPASVVNDNSTGDTPWSNPGNATATDASYASVNGLGFGSNYLWATDFGFSVPTGATINGIRVSLTGYVNSLSTANGILSIIKNGTIVDTANIIVDTEEFTNYVGSSTDLWNNTWTASDINDTDFGVAFWISGYDTFINSMQITVYYTAPSGDVLSYDNTSVASAAALGSASNPAPSSGSVINQQYTESSIFSTTTATNAGDSALWDFALTSSSAADGKTYCFRVVDDNGDPLDGGYDYYPEITFGSGGGNGPDDPPTLQQSTRGGGGVVNGVKKNFSWRND